MSFYLALGTALVNEEEFVEKNNEIFQFHSDREKGIKAANIQFSTGILTEENAITSYQVENNSKPISFKPIGIGKPLLITIQKVYTGKHPQSLLHRRKDILPDFLDTKKDMLVTSAIKSWIDPSAQSQAINMFKSDVGSHNHFEGASATQEGTPIVFYSPGLVDQVYFLDLSMTFDNFDQEVFRTLGSFLGKAAGIPVFVAPGVAGLSMSVFFTVTGELTKIAADIGAALFKNKPVLRSTTALRFGEPGYPVAVPGPVLVVDDSIDKSFLDEHHINDTFEVVDKSGKRYDGDIPYIVIKLDGTEDKRLNSFVPMAASAAILSRFLGESNSKSIGDSLLAGLTLYSDSKFRREADNLDKEIKKQSREYDKQLRGISYSSEKDRLMKERDDKISKLKEQRNAQAANIFDELLKPKPL